VTRRLGPGSWWAQGFFSRSDFDVDAGAATNARFTRANEGIVLLEPTPRHFATMVGVSGEPAVTIHDGHSRANPDPILVPCPMCKVASGEHCVDTETHDARVPHLIRVAHLHDLFPQPVLGFPQPDPVIVDGTTAPTVLEVDTPRRRRKKTRR
jgi:hypothetical protein